MLHRSLHMARVVTKLSPAKSGFTARKRIPVDVRAEYKRLYGVSSEEWFNSGPVSVALATAKMREWLTERENRIANIRAGRNGGGQELTPMRARALAGEWYFWFTARHLAKKRTAEYWEACASDYHDDFSAGVWGGSGEPWQEKDPLVVWNENTKAKAGARPVVADHGETAQFLHTRQMTLEPSTRDMFLDYVSQDLFEALGLLKLRAQGDYSEDKRPLQFPKLERTADPNLTPSALFKQWIAEVKPKDQTTERWRCVFVQLQADHPGATSMTSDEAQVWTRGLINSERGARTVRVVWVAAARTVFEWAKGQKLIAHNPFTGVKVTVPKTSTTRDGKMFTVAEIRTILKAARAISKPRNKLQAARRWTPWICAYTGARGGEITQLRGVDCIVQDGVRAIRITPDAGTVKTRRPRMVPLHEHLIDQGFLDFVKSNGKGPLFYSEPKTPLVSDDVTKPPKAPAVRMRESLAAWVRHIGVDDPEVQPNHAWRHTFKQIGHRAGITERVLDAITGHAPPTEGRKYGEPTLTDKADALKQFPRYSTGGHGSAGTS
jgi:integrase